MDRKYFAQSEDFNLTPHFRMSEMTFSVSYKFVMPDDVCRVKLVDLCQQHLEPLRSAFGPIFINSGYRDEKRNVAVKGAPNSYHLYGCACDILFPSIRWGIRYASYLLVNNDSVLEQYRISELILHKKQKYIHLAIRKGFSDNKFYVDIL